MLIEEKIQQISLDDLIPNPGNRRIGGFDPDKLQQLADSIQAVGVQQPIIIRPNGQSKFEIVVGERRWKAARIAGFLDIPAVIRDLDDVAVLKIQTIENLQREDIHPLDEVDGYSRLIEQAGYDVEHLAQEVGRSASYVYQRLKLRDLVPDARKMLVDGTIAAGHAILIARLQPAQQNELVKWTRERSRWKDEYVSVRTLDDWIHQTILLELQKAAFKKDDAELVPAAGPCTICPKRTGYQPALFADVCKKDFCTDADCYNSKLDALVERRRLDLAGEKYLQVIDTWLSYNEEKALPDDVKTAGAWDECKKKDEGAVRCLVVAGSGRGRLTWGILRKQNRFGYYEKSSQEKAADKKRKREQRIKKAARRQIWDLVMGAVDDHLQTAALPEALLRTVVLKTFDRLWDNYRAVLCRTEGWEKPPRKSGEYGHGWHEIGLQKIHELSEHDLKVMLVKCALVADLDVSEYSNTAAKDLNAAAVMFGFDPTVIEAAVREEEKAKEKAKAVRANRSKKTKKQPVATSGSVQK